MSKLISLIVPCYNQANYLDDCLQSVFSQTYNNWECIIINDGSTDNTEEIAKKWCIKDTRFVYIIKENGGLSSARNFGLKIAKGEYIQLLDSDDTINNLKFEKQIESFNDEIDISITDYFPFENRYNTFCSERYITPFMSDVDFRYKIVSLWEKKLSIPCHCIIFKKRLLFTPHNLCFDESLPNHEDWVFWTMLFYRSKGFININFALANYRIHKKSMCNDYVLMKKGFLLASNKLINFFENIGDKKGILVSRKKRYELEPKKNIFFDIYKFKRLVIMFIPPIILVVYSKIIKT